jgi:3-oxoacyl-[acyl-carrier protein] reductase
MEKRLTADDFASLFGIETAVLPSECKELISKFDSRYRILEDKERDEVILRVLARIDSPELTVAGPDAKARWVRGWGENLREFIESNYDFSTLVPKYIQPNQVNRFRGDYIMPTEPRFELGYYSIFRRWLFREYLSEAKNIYEFGCGTGYNLVELAQMYPEKQLHGLDWVEPSRDIVNLLAERYKYKAKGHVFDMANPDSSFAIEPGSAILAIGALEQLGTHFKPFIDYLVSQKPSVFVHVDSMLELYDENDLTDYLIVKFDKRRKYLEGYLPYLHELASRGAIEILKIQRFPLGSVVSRRIFFCGVAAKTTIMNLDIKGRYALVTGGTHGVGRAIALGLADEGVNVAVCSRSQDRIDETLVELKKRGVKAFGITADALHYEDIDRAFKAVMTAFPTLHILVNNVGGGGSWGSVNTEEAADDVWVDVYAKNALAAVRFTMRALPFMKRQKWGRVVTVTSKYGREGGGRPWFTMAKSAEMALMKTLALDPRFASAGITFNSVAPGNLMIPDTGLDTMRKDRPEEFSSLIEGSPQGRLGTPEEVANMAVFLCSEQASHITGASIPVDGAESKSF